MLLLRCFSVAIMFLILAYFLRFKQSGRSILDRWQPMLWIFLVHYPIVLWLQYWLYDYDLPAIVKALVAFVLTVALSWAVTAALQKFRRDARAVSAKTSTTPSLRGAKRRSNPFFPVGWIASLHSQ